MSADDVGNSVTDKSWTAGTLSRAEISALLALASRTSSPCELFAETIHARASDAAQVQRRLQRRGLVIRVPAATPPHARVLVLSTAGRVLAADLARRRERAQRDDEIATGGRNGRL